MRELSKLMYRSLLLPRFHLSGERLLCFCSIALENPVLRARAIARSRCVRVARASLLSRALRTPIQLKRCGAGSGFLPRHRELGCIDAWKMLPF